MLYTYSIYLIYKLIYMPYLRFVFFFVTAMGSVFDLNIHYNGKTGRVRNVDHDRYCYFDLLADVTDSVLSHMPSNEGIAITVHCAIPGSNEKLLLDSDTSVLEMFKLQCSGGLINLYVELQSNEAGKDVGDDMLNYLLSTVYS